MLEEETEATRLSVLMTPVLLGIMERLTEEVLRVRVVSGEEGGVAEALCSEGMKKL